MYPKLSVMTSLQYNLENSVFWSGTFKQSSWNYGKINLQHEVLLVLDIETTHIYYYSDYYYYYNHLATWINVANPCQLTQDLYF